MLTFDFIQTYPTFAAMILFTSGGLMLLYDVKAYHARNLTREVTWSKVLGWANMAVGMILFIVGLSYRYIGW